MGAGASRSAEEEEGVQLYVSLKLENYRQVGDLIPHVYGSVPIVGSWDSSKAVLAALWSYHLFFCVYGFVACDWDHLAGLLSAAF